MQFSIAQSPDPPPVTTVDIPLPSGADSIWILLAAIGGFLANQVFPKVWGHYQKQEEKETEITSTLVNNLLQNNERLLQGNLAGFKSLEQGQKDVEKAIVKLGETIQLEVQTTLKQQGIGYANVVNSQTEQIYLVKALHDRLDKYEVLWQALAEKLAVDQRKANGRKVEAEVVN